MKNLDSLGFKFKIGDIVEHKFGATNRIELIIVERIIRECSGGIQKSYSVRVKVPTFSVNQPTIEGKCIEVFEIELEPVNVP